MENCFADYGMQKYGESWTVVSERPFNAAELAAIREAAVVNSDYGISACFFMKQGGTYYIPISDRGAQPAVGSKLDLAKCTFVRLTRDGKFCNKVTVTL